MNERPTSGDAPGNNAYAYDAYSTGSHPTAGTVFAAAHQQYQEYEQRSEQYDPYQQYAPAPAQQGGYDRYEQQYGGTDGYGYLFPAGFPTEYGTDYGTGYDRTGTYPVYDPYAPGPSQPTQQTTGTAFYGTPSYGTDATGDTGTYDAAALWPGAIPQQATYPQQDWDSGSYPAYGYGYGYDANGDTGIYEQLGFSAAEPYGTQPQTGLQTGPVAVEEPAPGTGYEAESGYGSGYGSGYEAGYEAGYDNDYDAGYGGGAFEAEADAGPVAARAAAGDENVRHDYAADGPAGNGGGPAARSRRRKPAKRSALLTIAVPSVAVMGVAAVGAAAVGGVGIAQGAKSRTDAQGSGGSQPTTQLDRQLSGVSRDADDFATRASRTQERRDLKDRQAAAARARQEAAARKEALRPKFVLPVTQKGLSAYFGQAGEHWMSVHTGIDFPVQAGTPVRAATDGTVRTQWNPSYGNMAIVTAADGTETWYCHLSSTKIRSGKVKAGTVIAYSGNTGNTTGPHLHFEVRPGGGSPIDPLKWLLAHGLDPR